MVRVLRKEGGGEGEGRSESVIFQVCPICASMPWGVTHQVSQNFVKHLNARHKFEYNTYVVSVLALPTYHVLAALFIGLYGG